MLNNRFHATDDVAVVRRLISEHPWGTLISNNDGELIASHYPVMVDDEVQELTVLTHVGRPDDRIHGFADREILLIVQGEHGYISPSWYAPGASRVPTWNFTVAHCYGVPQILDGEENLAVLTRLVERFERRVEQPLLLEPEYGAQMARGTVGIRLPVTRFICKQKVSLDKEPETQQRVVAALRHPGPYQHPALADEMERVRAERG
ncbi:MAG TPA: FMN-binding negative transcriptional regulator [Solirubrobacteraceae bacterium]|jgi:transcriptional regulator|nr:FMN-binding negative transcriptional regulator [Solirubrobacteraceae bacterium]